MIHFTCQKEKADTYNMPVVFAFASHPHTVGPVHCSPKGTCVVLRFTNMWDRNYANQ